MTLPSGWDWAFSVEISVCSLSLYGFVRVDLQTYCLVAQELFLRPAGAGGWKPDTRVLSDGGLRRMVICACGSRTPGL